MVKKHQIDCSRPKTNNKQKQYDHVRTLKLIGFFEIAASIDSSPSKTRAGPGKQCSQFYLLITVDNLRWYSITSETILSM